MKMLKLIIILIVLTFTLDVGLAQQEKDSTNGWDLLVSWGTIDTTNTFTYFKKDSGQVFKNRGIQAAPGVLAMNLKKLF